LADLRVELRVTDRRHADVALGREVGELRRGRRTRLARERARDPPRDGCEQDEESEQLHRYALTGTVVRAGLVAGLFTRRRAPAGQMAIRPPRTAPMPPIQTHMTIGETMNRTAALGGSRR